MILRVFIILGVLVVAVAAAAWVAVWRIFRPGE